MVCNVLVVGSRLLGAEQQAMRPGRLVCCSAPNSRLPTTKTLHTICGNKTSTVSISWWWAYKCPKHVEQIISAIKHSVASSWFSSLPLKGRTAVAQWLSCGSTVVKVLCYNSEDRWFDPSWCQWIFHWHKIPGVDSASNSNEYQEYFLGLKAAGA